MRIGIDFGGVIVKTVSEGQSLGPDEYTEQPGAMAVIGRLVQKTDAKAWIISKASRRTQLATREWLQRVGFYSRTGFQPEHLIFCEKRAHKRYLCVTLGITHFIDDNEETLGSLVGCVPELFLFGSQPRIPGIESAQTWRELGDKLA